jgi:uncharacterized protein
VHSVTTATKTVGTNNTITVATKTMATKNTKNTRVVFSGLRVLGGFLVLRRFLVVYGCLLLSGFGISVAFAAQEPPPELTAPVNDFANVIDDSSERAMESLVRSLEQASGDAVVVATVDTFQPYGDIREYAVRMFENGGRGIGRKGKDNGVLILLAENDRQVWIEVGYDLEQFITDGYAGETSRQYMVPEFRRGNYGAGLLAGTSRIIGRIAEARGVTLQGVRPPRSRDIGPAGGGSSLFIAFIIFIVAMQLIARVLGFGRRRRFRRGWGGYYGGWSSGVGPFGGGGFGGGGFGGGFGGFGGGRSGGGGGGASW